MKKLYTIITVLALSLAVGVTAMAQGKKEHRGSHKVGCSSCDKAVTTPEQIRKFKADTIDLRQEMMNKRFDLQRENLKETPDSTRVAAIKAEMEAIKVKIDTLKTAAKLPVSASCCMEDCPLMDGNCDKCKSWKSGDKSAKAGKHCKDCDKKAECGCKDCSCKECKGAGCDKCDKAVGCDKCKKGKAAKK